MGKHLVSRQGAYGTPKHGTICNLASMTRLDPKQDPRLDPRLDLTQDPMPDPKQDPRMNPRLDTMQDPRLDPTIGDTSATEGRIPLSSTEVQNPL